MIQQRHHDHRQPDSQSPRDPLHERGPGQHPARHVAVNRRWQDRETKEWEESTSFFDVVCWRELAENAALSLAKGMRVMVTGRLEQRTWETDEGERRSKVEIVAEEVGPSLRFATADVHAGQQSDGGADPRTGTGAPTPRMTAGPDAGRHDQCGSCASRRPGDRHGLDPVRWVRKSSPSAPRSPGPRAYSPRSAMPPKPTSWPPPSSWSRPASAAWPPPRRRSGLGGARRHRRVLRGLGRRDSPARTRATGS